MRRIKLLYISQATGGVKRHIAFLASHLDRNHFEITGCFPPRDRVKGVNPDKESFLDLFQRLGLRTISLDMYREIHPLQDLWAFLKLYRILRKEKWEIVHTHSSKAGFLGRIAARLAGVPIVVHTPNAFAFDRPPHSALNLLYVLLEKIAGVFCDALIAVSPSEAQLAHQVVSPEKIELICNGIDVEELTSDTNPREKKKELGLPEESPMVLTIGRFAPQKAPGVFIDASKKVFERRPDTTVVMVGDGPLFQQVKDRIEQENLKKRFFLFDWRSDIQEILASCDVYVLSSLWEGLPYTVLEAMALQKPVVATEARGTRDAVKDGVTGFLVGLHDAEKMAERILTLLSNPELARQMGKEGRKRVIKEFPLKPHLEKTSALYERLLKKKGMV